jgi:hypothetical protein
MSTERINQITFELTESLITLREVCAKVLPLVQELENLGVHLPPEIRKMFLNLTKMN